MKIKLFSFWIGPKPGWWRKFVCQWDKQQTLIWEHLPFTLRGWNDLVTVKMGFSCRKAEPYGLCDFRPAYGELFQDRLEGYDWWGWVDPDVMLGDVDGILPDVLNRGWDVVSFKPRHLSGCMTLLRNKPDVNEAFRRGKYREVMGNKRYHVWDDSGYHWLGEGFHDVLVTRTNLRVKLYPELYGYDAEREPNKAEFKGGKLYQTTGHEIDTGEKLFFHFMSKKWPVKDDGSSRHV